MTIIMLFILTGLTACDAESDNPTNMKGRTITPARVPHIEPMRLPKIPASVRRHLDGNNEQSRTSAPTPTTTSTERTPQP